MATPRLVKLGCYVPRAVLLSKRTGLQAYLHSRKNIFAQILLTLKYYLSQYTEKVGKMKISCSAEENEIHPNGSLNGLIKYLNQSALDISIQTLVMDESTTKVVDFAYPYKLSQITFVTSKPVYKPQLFGIFQTFSQAVWFAVAIIFVLVALVYCVTMRRKYSPDKILLHIFGVLLKQSSTLRSRTIGHNVLFFSWVFGALILCLSYDSVFLSFLSFPPVTPINNLSQLAKAVEKGEYHCLTLSSKTFLSFLKNSQSEELNVIARDLDTNELNKGSRFKTFVRESGKQNLAFLMHEKDTSTLAGRYFVAKEPILELMPAMMVRKNFCCKELLDSFVNKIVSAGLYFKYVNDRNFLISLSHFLKYPVEDIGLRKLTLADVAPAFIFLLVGYLLSFLVFLGEILLNRKKKRKPLKKDKRKNKICVDVSA